jgi:hypothetical protein
VNDRGSETFLRTRYACFIFPRDGPNQPGALQTPATAARHRMLVTGSPAQVPGFSVKTRRSGRVFHAFTSLSPHHEIILEPSEWREVEERDGGRSLIHWASRTPGMTLSMHRRPDGTFSGIFGGQEELFERISDPSDPAEYKQMLIKAFAGLAEDWADSMAAQVGSEAAAALVHDAAAALHVHLPFAALPPAAILASFLGPLPLWPSWPTSCMRTYHTAPRRALIAERADFWTAASVRVCWWSPAVLNQQ